MNETLVIKSFAFTDEYYRFGEFCDACKRNRYIGLCYGAAGVGKTLSARRYTHWDEMERFDPANDSLDELLERLGDSLSVLYTPEVGNTPRQVQDGIHSTRMRLYNILEDRVRREYEPEMEAQRECLSRAASEDGHFNRERYDEAASKFHQTMGAYRRKREAIPKPSMSLVIVDEADWLKMASLEQVRYIFDRSEVGLVLIGMPGIEKKLARYPQLYSRVGFVHEYRPLSKTQVLSVLRSRWRPAGVHLPISAFDDQSLAAIVRITAGNFRLLHRLLTQIARVVEINSLERVTVPVIDAARESLVIGVA